MSQGRWPPLDVDKVRNMRILPQSLQRGTQPDGPLDFSQWDPYHTSGPQNCKLINVLF